ncbi:MAG: prephenate dehydrogenase [Nitrososphaerota archaeon]|nr:prephenate dehydrogenase [Nitrososphaerota archaeon]MDG6938828.1 prephenate dehydrogenase [Nitrososphaerota archaeon]
MKVAVLGCSGGMGTLFSRHLLAGGHTVYGIDPRRPAIRHRRFRYQGTEGAALGEADVALVSVPLDRTTGVVLGLLPRMKPTATIAEISSIKGDLFESAALRGASQTILSLHPLFGPAPGSLKGARMALVPFRSRAKEEAVARDLFPGMKLLVVGAEEHDRMMSWIISLTHALNVAYARSVAGSGLDEFMRLATPFASMQLTLAEAVLSQDPSLCSDLQVHNRHSAGAIRELQRSLDDLAGLVERKDRRAFEEYFLRTRGPFGERLSSAYRAVYSASKATDE